MGGKIVPKLKSIINQLNLKIMKNLFTNGMSKTKVREMVIRTMGSYFEELKVTNIKNVQETAIVFRNKSRSKILVFEFEDNKVGIVNAVIPIGKFSSTEYIQINRIAGRLEGILNEFIFVWDILKLRSTGFSSDRKLKTLGEKIEITMEEKLSMG